MKLKLIVFIVLIGLIAFVGCKNSNQSKEMLQTQNSSLSVSGNWQGYSQVNKVDGNKNSYATYSSTLNKEDPSTPRIDLISTDESLATILNIQQQGEKLTGTLSFDPLGNSGSSLTGTIDSKTKKITFWTADKKFRFDGTIEKTTINGSFTLKM